MTALRQEGPLLMAANRGILIAAVYGVAAFAGLSFALARTELAQLDMEHAWLAFAALGLVVGSIPLFSARQDGPAERDLGRESLDVLVALLWLSLPILTANLALGFDDGLRLMGHLGGLALGAGASIVVGVPVLRLAGRFPVGSFVPAAWINDLTARVESPDLRLALRVVLHTLLFALVVALIVVTVTIVLLLIALWLAFWILGHLLGDGSTVTVHRRPALRIPNRGRIRDDGRVVEEGILFDRPTGQRVREDGRVVEEGLLVDQHTGLKIGEDGRVHAEGLIFDHATGVRLDDDGRGGQRVVNEGLILDRDTGFAIGADGRVTKSGLLFDSRAGVEIDAAGEVREPSDDEGRS